MFIIAGTISVDPDDRDAFLEAAVAAAAGTRTEPGNQEYVFSADTVDAGLVRLFEIWDDDDSLKPHFKTDHMRAFFAATKDLGVTGRSLTKYTVSDTGPL